MYRENGVQMNPSKYPHDLYEQAKELGIPTNLFNDSELQEVINMALQDRAYRDILDKQRAAELKILELRSCTIFSPRTQKNRQYLILSSAITLSMTFLGLVPTEIQAFGLKFLPEQQVALLKGAALVVLYFFAMFITAGWNDQRIWLANLNTAISKYRGDSKLLRKMKNGPEESIADLLETDKPLRSYSIFNPSLRNAIFSATYFVEFFLPLILATFAIFSTFIK